MMTELPAALDLVRDPEARSESYYSQSAHPAVDRAVVAALKSRVRAEGGTIRVCLHPGAAAALHEMVVVHRRGGSFRQHKHLTRDESYHMIEGVMRVELYDDDGRVRQVFLIGDAASGRPFLLRVSRQTWHATIPETEFAVFHETRTGPLDRADSVFRDEQR